MSVASQVLTIVGLFLEFTSVYWAVRKLFYDYSKRIDELAKHTMIQSQIERDKAEGIKILVLLCMGMLLQGVAVLLA